MLARAKLRPPLEAGSGPSRGPARVVLGVADNHDAGACLVIDGEVVSAISEERLDRVKNSGAFPHRAIEAVLKLGGVGPAEIDAVAIGTACTPAAALRMLRSWHHRLKAGSSQFSYLLHLYILYQVALRRAGLIGLETSASGPILRRELARSGLKAPLHFVDHHTSHAVTAARTSPWESCLVITLDAMGDGTSVTVHRSENGELTPLYRQSGLAAINTCYSRVTEVLGFIPLRHEGKITGLAAYAEAPEALRRHFEQQLHFVGPGFNTTPVLLPGRPEDAFYSVLKRYSREEVAAAVQANLEAQVCRFVSWWCRQTGLRHVAVAGGVFANVKLNQRLHELPEVQGLHVYPLMSDGGLPAGAAMLLGASRVGSMPTAFLGPAIDAAEARVALRAAGLGFEEPPDLADRVAGLLVAGKVVARASGRLEWGPRALGNRSILFRPDIPSVNDWLNKRLRRTEFMPFAPSTREEEADRCYHGLERARDAARFMTVCFDCTPWMKEHCGGVVHVDGTARPQLVRRQDSPEYHAILEAVATRTGVGTVINTSFNMHEEPIVCSAEDAIRAWQEAELDALVLGPTLTIRQPIHR